MRSMTFNRLTQIVIAGLAIWTAAEATAGSMQTVCRSARNTVALSTGNFSMNVVKISPDSIEVGELRELMDFQVNSRAAVYVPGGGTADRIGEILIKAVGTSRLVRKEGGEPCPDGNGGMTAHGPGAETSAFPLTIELTLSGTKETVHLNCRETVGYSGRCVFEE
ncbi:MAG TPA: hypothetical protein PLZ57_16355 [Pseudobdellovibrionaceae bacterium]|nr:hypothetical protein [Pseudobdellovibrionaceae bacterium]